MADGDYLAEPTAPPTCSPAPGILGLVVFQRLQRLESPGLVGSRDRNSQQGVRCPALAGRTRKGPGGRTSIPLEPAGLARSSLRARKLSLTTVQWWRRGVGAGGQSPSVTLEAGVMYVKSGCRNTTSPLAPGFRLDGRPSVPPASKFQPTLPARFRSPVSPHRGSRCEAPLPGLGRLPIQTRRASPGRLDKTQMDRSRVSVAGDLGYDPRIRKSSKLPGDSDGGVWDHASEPPPTSTRGLAGVQRGPGMCQLDIPEKQPVNLNTIWDRLSIL